MQCLPNTNTASIEIVDEYIFVDYPGMTGQKCDRCSVSDHYVGNATGNGTCYYPLLISYQYTFTLDSKSDPYVSAINFVNVSSTKEEIDFNIQLEVSIYF